MLQPIHLFTNLTTKVSVMTYKESLDKVYNDIDRLALELYRSGKTITRDELINWMKKNHHELPTPCNGIQSLLQASFDRTDDEEIQNAIRTVFVNKKGKSLWL